MNEAELKQYCLEHAGEPMSAEAHALMQRDPELKRHVDRLMVIQKLMSLKRHEIPHPSSLNRCLASVQARIEEHESGGWWARLRASWVFETPAPAMAVAAVALVAIGLAFAWRPGADGSAAVAAIETAPPVAQPEAVVLLPELPDLLADIPAETEEQRDSNTVELAAETIPTAEKPLIILRVDPAVTPYGERIRFGVPDSTPVNFEY